MGLLVALSLPGLRLVSHGFYRYDARPMSFLLGLTMTVYLVLLAGLALVILLLLRTGRHSERPVAATHHAPPS